MYSQQHEERYILDALSGIATGRLLDIGAFHPTVFSNSRALIERGWSAVLVEPSPEPFLTLLREYGKNEAITLVHAAVGLESGLVKMQATADAVSTTDEHSYEIWKDSAQFDGSFLTPMVTLDAPVFNGPFDFISIDTEGTNFSIFGAVLNRFQPRCICVEHDYRADEMAELAAKSGYKVTHDNGTNLILTR